MIGRLGVASFLLLAIVLAGLGLHAVWVLKQSNDSLSQVITQHNLVSLYHQSEVALLRTHASGERFSATASPLDRAEFEKAVQSVFTSLASLATLGGEAELALTTRLFSEYSDEIEALPAFISALEAGDEPSYQFDGGAVTAITAQLAASRALVAEQADGAFSAFGNRLDDQVYIALMVFGLGTPLALGAMFFLLHYQKKERIAEIKLASLNAISRIDGLTGVGNLRAFQEQLLVETDASIEHGTPVSLALIDLDYLKAVNDQRGHLEGDVLLAGLGILLRDMAEQHGTVSAFRVGGDEFALLMPGQDQAAAEKIINDLRARGQDSLGGRTFSAGIATSHGGSLESQALRELADACLYMAKGRGRDMVVVGGEETVAA